MSFDRQTRQRGGEAGRLGKTRRRQHTPSWELKLSPYHLATVGSRLHLHVLNKYVWYREIPEAIKWALCVVRGKYGVIIKQTEISHRNVGVQGYRLLFHVNVPSRSWYSA